MKKTKNTAILFLLLAFLLIFASCASRRNVKSDTKAARAAEAMAALKSKDLYRFITEWTGVKYKLGGMDKRGIDCSGFAYLFRKRHLRIYIT